MKILADAGMDIGQTAIWKLSRDFLVPHINDEGLKAWLESNDELALGDAAYEKKDYLVAMRSYLKAAGDGNADAENSIGFMYDNGFGVPQDYSAALRWYRRAAIQAFLRPDTILVSATSVVPACRGT